MSKKNDQKFRITINNWDKYQPEIKGKAREWIRFNTGLIHDPDFFALTLECRYLWMAMLCHAGAVGPVFKLSPSDARVLFKLRRSADFSPLRDQGFIEFEILTDGRNRHDVTDKTLDVKKSKKKKADQTRDEQFQQIKNEYPKRHNYDQRWAKARQHLNARLKEGVAFYDILAGVIRYRQYCEAAGSVGTKWVKQAATFLGTERCYELPWDPPTSKAEDRTSRNLSAIDQALKDSENERK